MISIVFDCLLTGVVFISTLGYMENLETGIVKWFSFEKGYGFISRPNGSELFFHISDVQTKPYLILHEGQRVRYEAYKKKVGFEARNILVL